MQLSVWTVFYLALAGAALWFWQDSLRVRDAANRAAMESCQRLGLQFLDGTVAFSRLSLLRVTGQLRLRRTYVFDYTARSIERLQGFVVMVGLSVESVGFAREPDAQPGNVATPASYDATTQLRTDTDPADGSVEESAYTPGDAATENKPMTGVANRSGSSANSESGRVLYLSEWRRKSR